MIKICANVGKKVPLPGVEFSSQQFGAAMEIEVSDADPPEVVQRRLQELYALLSEMVDKQIEHASQMTSRLSRQLSNGGCKECQTAHGLIPARPVNATPAQVRALFAICKDLGIECASVLSNYNATDFGELSIKDASHLIHDLRSRKTKDSDFDHYT